MVLLSQKVTLLQCSELQRQRVSLNVYLVEITLAKIMYIFTPVLVVYLITHSSQNATTNNCTVVELLSVFVLDLKFTSFKKQSRQTKIPFL